MSKKLATLFGLMLVVSIIATACGSSPVSVKSFGSCPVTVNMSLYARTPYGGYWEGGNWMGNKLLDLGTTKFIAQGYNDTPENYNGGMPNWRFDQSESERFDQYFIATVEPAIKKFNSNLAKAFVGFDVFEVREFLIRDAIYDTFSSISHVIDYADSCPEGGFTYNLPLYMNDAPLEQTDVKNGMVFFRYTTSAGSVFNFTLSEDAFVSILTDGYVGHSPVSITTNEVEASQYSGSITRMLMKEGALEVGSYSIVPADTQGRTEIYSLVAKILRYVSNDVTVLSTFQLDLKDLKESQLWGTILMP